MLQIKKIIKTYPNGENKLYALNQISLEIKDGEFAVILGPSGSGKSTNVDMPDFESGFPIFILSMSIIAPVAFFTLCSVLTARVKLRHPPLTMIRESTPLKTGVLARCYSKRKANRPFLKELSSTIGCVKNTTLR